MCLRTAFKASVLCSIPGLVGFGAAMLSVHQPKLFLWGLVLSLGSALWVGYKSYARAGGGERESEVEDVDVAAGALLALSFLFAFWTGLAVAAGLGILTTGVMVAVSTAMLAAFTLTFVKNLLNRKVRWVEAIVQRLHPENDLQAGERA